VDSAAGENLQWSPRAVAGGKYVLYTSFTGSLSESRIGIVESATGTARAIKALRGTYVLGYVDGRVLYVRTDGVVQAAPLDLASGVTGEGVPLLDSVAVALNIATAAISPSGDLVYVRGGGKSRIGLVGLQGQTRPLIDEERGYLYPMLSPDGQKVAVTIGTAGGSDVWLYDLRGKTFDRVTSEGTNDRAEWTPDGKRLIYTSNRAGVFSLWWQAVDGSDQAEKIYGSDEIIREVAVVPDGRGVVFRHDTGKQARNISFYSFADKKVTPIVTGVADVTGQQVVGVRVGRIGDAGGVCARVPGSGRADRGIDRWGY
jgi:dipeptidyl aminopeptidase/acylaminoacyl peptidase